MKGPIHEYFPLAVCEVGGRRDDRLHHRVGDGAFGVRQKLFEKGGNDVDHLP